jgi:trehalose-phosphatase
MAVSLNFRAEVGNQWFNIQIFLGKKKSSKYSNIIQSIFITNSRTPGSVLEEKDVGIAWHYNVSDVKYGEWQAAECQNHINNALKTYSIHLLKRKSCIEVYLREVSKATAIRRILQFKRHRGKRLSVQSNLSEETTTPVLSSTQASTSDFALDGDLCDFILVIGNDRADGI